MLDFKVCFYQYKDLVNTKHKMVEVSRNSTNQSYSRLLSLENYNRRQANPENARYFIIDALEAWQITDDIKKAKEQNTTVEQIYLQGLVEEIKTTEVKK